MRNRQVAWKLHKTVKNLAAKPEKHVCEQLSCPKQAESRFRLSAAEEKKGGISSLDRVAATWHDCVSMRSEEKQQEVSIPIFD
jgi:hypothetical protein